MTVTYFHERPDGPEAEIEDYVSAQAVELLSDYQDLDYSIASSLSVGAGHPDLIVIGHHEEAHSLLAVDEAANDILAYLRSVRSARSATISANTSISIQLLESTLEELVDVGAICEANSYSIAEPWDDILPDVIAIEIKVSDWRRALKQAMRNRLFTHRSYVALPENIAERITSHPYARASGIGILAVDCTGHIQILKNARYNRPRIWQYYYRIAYILANYF